MYYTFDINIYSADGTVKFPGQSFSPYSAVYLLADGSMIAFIRGGNYDGFIFVITLNPTKKKLIVGRDVFEFLFLNNNSSYVFKGADICLPYSQERHNAYVNYCSSHSFYSYSYCSVCTYCSSLIVRNSFSIPKDYPVKF